MGQTRSSQTLCPFIFAEICSANIGGASTMVGDPPDVILGTYFGLSFMDFMKNTGRIVWIGFAVNALFFIGFYRGEIFSARSRLRQEPSWLEQQVITLCRIRACPLPKTHKGLPYKFS